MKKKNLFLGVLLASTAFSLAACGNNTPATTSNTGDVITNTGDTTNTGETTPAVEKVTVTFNTNGGSAVSSVEINKGEKVTKPATDPTKTATADEKYTFGGWYKDAGCSEAFDFNATINSNTTVYAKWNVEGKVSVAFNTAGGSTVDVQYVFAGEKITAPATNPTKAATAQYTYTFGGWYKDAEYTEEFDFTAPITAETVVYAKWDATVNKYNITFNTNGAARLQPINDVEYGTKVAAPETPTPREVDGKEIIFGGWYKDKELTEEFYFGSPVTGDLTLYAKWIEIDEGAYQGYTKIANIQDFMDFRNDSAISKNVVLLDDIDLEGIALEGTKVIYSGQFDGLGHSIKNASYTDNAAEKSGVLTKELRDGAKVSNVRFVNCIAQKAQETIGMVTGLLNGTVEVSKVEFNGCMLGANNYAGFIGGRIDAAGVNLTISEITAKNGCKVTVTNYGGTLIGDIDKTSATDRAVVNISDCDLDIQLAGSNANGGFLSGRMRQYTDLTISNVLIRNSELPSATGLVCGGGDNNAGNSTVTVNNLYIMNSNAAKLQSCALQTGSNPVTTFKITYTNCYMASDALAKITDNVVNSVTYLQSVDKTTTDVDWLKNTLQLDFTDTGTWTTEALDATAYRLKESSTNVKSPDATIEKLKGTTANAQVRFEQGTDFTTAGLSITGIYSDGVNLVIKENVDYVVDSSEFNKDVPGKYTITVKSIENEEKIYTYEVEVVELLSFEVDTQFAKITYVPGEKSEYDSKTGKYKNLFVYGNWSDGKRLLFDRYTSNAAEISVAEAGVKDLVVSVPGFDDQIVKITVIDTKPVIVDNFVYINVDASAELDVVGQKINGVETFNTVHEAVDYLAALKLDAKVNKVIYVADGIYTEKVTIPASLTNLKIVGESRENTRIEYDAVEDTYNPVSGKAYTMDCATLHVNAEGFGLENITINNTFDYITNHNKYGNPQGFALTIAADGAVIDNVTLYGNQDTLFFKKGRVYIKDSLIMGNIDFIFGENDGIAFFDDCTIKAINKSTKQETNNGYVTAMKGDGTKHPTYGYVFNNCTFTDDGTLGDGSMSLGRPWGAGASVAMINCSFTAAYSTLAYDGSAKSRWFNMSGNSPVDAHFCEYGSTGDGAITTAVAGGSVLSETEAENYTAANTFAKTNGGVTWSAVFDYTTAYNTLVATKNKVAATGIMIIEAGEKVTGDTYTIFFEDSVAVDIVPTEWNAEDKAVEVSIEDESIVSYENGKFNGLAIGQTTVTLTCGTATRTITLNVEQAVQYEVTFVTTGSAVETQYIFRNKKATMPTTAKEGAVFKGWYKDAEYSEEFDFDTPITSETTIYARFVNWEDMYKENIVVYFNGTEGDGIDTFEYAQAGSSANTNANNATYCGIVVDGKLAARAHAEKPSEDAQFNTGVTMSFAVEKYATITLTARNLNGSSFTFKLGDEEVTPTVSTDGLTFVYETTKAGVFHVINGAKNAYLSSLSVTYPEIISKTTQITFGTDGNYKDMTCLDQSAAAYKEVKDPHTQMTGQLVFYVVPGSTILISGNWGIDFTINDGERIQNTNAGGSYNGTSYEYVSTTGGKIVLKAGDTGKNYLTSIKIVAPSKMSTSTTINFGTNGNWETAIDGFKATGGKNHNDGKSCQFSNGKITLSLEKDAKITIVGNWAVDYTINKTTVVQSKEVTGNTEDEANLNYVYNATAGDVVIEIGNTSKCYFYTIKVEME